MRLKRIIVITAALSVITLNMAVLPAQGQGAKGESPKRPPTVEARRALTVEAQAARANRFAADSGALGAYFDESTGQHVVVVSHGSAAHSDDLAQAVGAPARVDKQALSKGTVDSLQGRIAGRAFHPDATSYSYASYVDLAAGKVVLQTDAPAQVTAALSAEFGDSLDQRAGAVSDDASRQADTSPFWGGASIKSGGGVCSSGFVVKKPSGTRYLTTAGHCFPIGASVLTTGGNLSVGTVVQRGPIPPFDMELIGGRSYGPSVYSGGTNSSTSRRVLGASDPVVGYTGYCRSGQTTGEQCNQRVISVTATICTATGCKYPVIAYDNGGASAGGDSGAPFYLPSGGDAFIRGMHIGSGGGTMYAEKWSRISSNLGVSIVT